AIAHRRGGGGQRSAQRQQHRQAARRAVAVGGGRRARVEIPALARIQRARQRQAALHHGPGGKLVQRIAGRQRGGECAQAGVVQRAQQAVDLAAVLQPRLAGQAGVGAGAGRGGAARVVACLQRGRAGQLPARLQRRRQRGRIAAGQRGGGLGRASVLDGQFGA